MGKPYRKEELEEIAQRFSRPFISREPIMAQDCGASQETRLIFSGLSSRDVFRCFEYYDEGLDGNGFKGTAKEARWGSREAPPERIRREVFYRYDLLFDLVTGKRMGTNDVGSGERITVLNIGEGSGGDRTSFYDYLVERGLERKVDTWGIDINPRAIARARSRHPRRASHLFLMNLLTQSKPEEFALKTSGKRFPHFANHSDEFPQCFSYVLASGIFCLMVHDPPGYARAMFHRMLDMAQYGFAVNFLNRATVDFQEPHLYYMSPDRLLKIGRVVSEERGEELVLRLESTSMKPYEMTFCALRTHPEKHRVLFKREYVE